MGIDYIFTVISGICTAVSIYEAHKSCSYYNKSKKLSVFANNNAAYIESKKINSLFGDLVKLASPKQDRGVNIQKEISNKGGAIRDSLDRIREMLSVEDYEEVEKVLCSDTINVDKYINSVVTCDKMLDNKFNIDEDFYNAQKAFSEMQKLLKRKITLTEDSLLLDQKAGSEERFAE